MTRDRRLLTLAMALAPGVGGKTITRFWVRHELLGRTDEDVWTLTPEVLIEEYRWRAAAANRWTEERATLRGEAQELLERLDRMNVGVVTAADPHYPHHVEHLEPDPPGVLFLYGNQKLLHQPTFTVLASRGGTDESTRQIERLTEDGVIRGEVLVAGHNTPAYQRAAVVPLRWGAPRIMVLDTGLFEGLGEDLSDEPFRAARLWRYKFDPKTDLALSAVNPLRSFHRNANRVRDRLVAGLSYRLDFAYIAPNGNMEHIALAALRTGRPVRVGETVPRYEWFAGQGARIALLS